MAARLKRGLIAFLSTIIAITSVGLGPMAARADGNNPLSYHFGPVITAPKVYIDFWGPEWSNGFNDAGYSAQQVMNYITTYFQDVGGSDWLSTVTQYWQNPTGNQKTYITNPANQLKGVPWIDSHAVPQSFSKADVLAEAMGYAIPHFADIGDYNAVYFIFTGPNKTPSDLGSHCGYHDRAPYNSHSYAYAYVPYQTTTANCSFAGQVQTNTSDSFGHAYLDGFSISGGHEYAEAITDPDTTIPTQTGWWDNVYCSTGGSVLSCNPSNLTNDEIGDKCANPSAPSVVEHPLFGDVVLGNQYFASQGLWSNSLGACSLGSTWRPSTPCASEVAWTQPVSPSLIGTQVTIFASASGCQIPLHEFWILPPGGSWQIVQSYSMVSQFTWNTAGLTPGTYYFVVGSRDAASLGTNYTGWRWDASTEISFVLPQQPTGLMVAENSSFTWVAHGTRLEKFNLGGAGANLFSTSTSGTTGPDALGYFDFGANITAIAVNESYLYIGLSTGRVIKTTMCGQGYNPCAFSDNMGGFTQPGYSYWIGVQDYSLGAVTALAVNSSYLFASLGTRTVKTGLCTSGGSMCWANSSGTGPVAGGGGQYYGFQDWSAPVIAQAANDSYVFTSMYGNGLTRVCKTGLGSSGSDVFALSSGACTGNYPGYSDWWGYQDMAVPVVGLAADPGHVFWSLGTRLVQTNMCSSGGNVCAFSDGYGSGSLAGYADWVGSQDLCSGYQAASVTSSLSNRGQNPWVDWAFSTGGGMSRIVQAYPGTGFNMFATGDCTGTSPYPGYYYWIGYQNLSI